MYAAKLKFGYKQCDIATICKYHLESQVPTSETIWISKANTCQGNSGHIFLIMRTNREEDAIGVQQNKSMYDVEG